MKRLGIALALVCSATGAAKADWAYTKWGMTPAQVTGAAKNLTKKNSDLHPDSDGNVTKLVAPYKSGKFSFEAQFGFDPADRLSSVTLVLKDKSAAMDMGMDMGADMNMKMDQDVCHDLGASVKTQYGPRQGGGAAHALYSIETWQDQKSSNDIEYAVLSGVGCDVEYSVVKPAGAH